MDSLSTSSLSISNIFNSDKDRGPSRPRGAGCSRLSDYEVNIETMYIMFKRLWAPVGDYVCNLSLIVINFLLLANLIFPRSDIACLIESRREPGRQSITAVLTRQLDWAATVIETVSVIDPG